MVGKEINPTLRSQVMDTSGSVAIDSSVVRQKSLDNALAQVEAFRREATLMGDSYPIK